MPPLPRLVFFFDEAHLLFDNAPPSLLQQITQVVRLIRSRGVGIFFVTQYPNDIPDVVLGQLGCRIQHALRAFTPKDQKAVRVAAETFRQNPQIDTATLITELGTGEALVSTLDEQGRPTMVDWCLLSPPRSHIGALDSTERERLLTNSPLRGLYDNPIDRQSAHEVLTERAAALQPLSSRPRRRNPRKRGPAGNDNRWERPCSNPWSAPSAPRSAAPLSGVSLALLLEEGSTGWMHPRAVRALVPLSRKAAVKK